MRDRVPGLSFTNLCPWILAYFSYNKTVAKWKELPYVTTSALLLLPRKGALEAAPEPEITNFSKRERLQTYFCQKDPRNTSIPRTRAQKLFIAFCSSGKRPDSWNSCS